MNPLFRTEHSLATARLAHARRLACAKRATAGILSGSSESSLFAPLSPALQRLESIGCRTGGEEGALSLQAGGEGRGSATKHASVGRAFLSFVVVLAFPRFAHAHGAGTVTPENWPAAWNADPLVVLNVVVLAALYLRGWRRLRRRSGTSQSLRLTAFMTSLGLVVLALLSPVDALSEELSSVHMVQHTLLMTAAAPLFVAAAPGLVLLHGLDRATRRLVGALARRLGRLELFRWLGQPLAGWLVFAVMLWVWHLPLLYEAALQDPWVHDVQHLTFFGSACLFWRVLLHHAPARRLSGAAAVFYLFTTSLHAAALGVFMTLSPRPWYPAYASRTPAWGLTPLEDQQLAGLIMWMPACLIYAAAAAALFVVWLETLTPEPDAAATPHRKEAAI